jgi:hypothetical protein
MNQKESDFPEATVLIASALLLMTRFAVTGCPFLLHMVTRQLQFLARHPREEVSPMLREVCQKLAEDWENLLHHMQTERQARANTSLH